MAILLNPKTWAVIAAAVFLAVYGLFCARLGRAPLRAEFDAYKTAQAEQRLLADRAQRHEETRRQSAIDKEAADASARIATLETDLAGARSAADGLQHAAANAAERARKGAQAAAPVAAQSGGDPLDLLVGVLTRHSGELVAVGEYADRLRIAGLACERSYDALSVIRPEAR